MVERLTGETLLVETASGFGLVPRYSQQCLTVIDKRSTFLLTPRGQNGELAVLWLSSEAVPARNNQVF